MVNLKAALRYLELRELISCLGRTRQRQGEEARDLLHRHQTLVGQRFTSILLLHEVRPRERVGISGVALYERDLAS